MSFYATLPLDPLIQETPFPKEKKQPVYKTLFQSTATQCIAAYREAISDLRSIRWARAGIWALFGIWTSAILGVAIFLIPYGIESSDGDITACRPDNSFNVFATQYNSWAASGFFEINLGGGYLTFTQAKVADISWDIVVGRGGQAVLAFISWRVFADYVTTSMEFIPVPYTVFSIIYLQDESSILSTFRIARAFISERGLKSKLSMTFIILTMLFLIGWPTFASAMTGYTTTVKAFVLDYDGNYIPYADFQPVGYIIHDGERVNLTKDYTVALFNAYFGKEIIIYNSFSGPFSLNNFFQTCDILGNSPDCNLQRNISNYVESYGFYGLQNIESTWMNNTLPSPTLNISAFYFTEGSSLYGYHWIDPRPVVSQQPFQDIMNLTLIPTHSNNTYPLSYIQENGRCQPVQDRFKWGFSFTQLFIVLILLNIWTIGMYTMWLKARFQLPLQGEAEVPRGWKSVLLLAEKMSKELQEAGIDVHSLTDQQMKDKVKKQLQGGSVSLDTHLTKRGHSFRRGIKQWYREKRPWCLTMLLTSLLLIGGWCGSFILMDIFTLIWLPCVILGLAFAIGAGSTIRSSLLMALFWGVGGFLIIFILYEATDDLLSGS